MNDFVTYKMVADYNIRNDKNVTIANAMNALYKSPLERLTSKGMKKPVMFYFDIEITNKDVGFYLTLPTDTEDLVIPKMRNVWDKANIHKCELENTFEVNKTELAQLDLKTYNFKSLSTDKGDLFPLTNLLGLYKTLQEGEKVRVSICIEPLKRTNWVALAEDEHKAFKSGERLDREVSKKEEYVKKGFEVAEKGLEMYIDIQTLFIETLIGNITPNKEENKTIVNLNLNDNVLLNKLDGVDHHSTYKKTAEAFLCRMLVLSQSDNDKRARINVLSAVNAYKDLNGDNELVATFPSKKFIPRILKHDFNGSKECILCDREVAKLIQLPQKTLQSMYSIESIQQKEIKFNEEIFNGDIRVGDVKISTLNKVKTAYFSNQYKKLSWTTVYMGPEGCGKTTQIKRLAKEMAWSGNSNIMIDFIDENELAREVMEGIDKSKRVVIEVGSDEIPSLSYNEVSKFITDTTPIVKRLKYASMISDQVQYLINSITNSGVLTDAMDRLLQASVQIVFIKPHATLYDVIMLLRNPEKVQSVVSYAESVGLDDEEIYLEMKRLEAMKPSDKTIEGILSRFTQLTKTPYIKSMLKAKVDYNQDINRWIDEGKSIFILIPQSEFQNPKTRDILTTYYTTRIWLAVQVRKNNKTARLCNLIFDEVHQMPNTASFISNHVNEFRRHALGLTISCHFLGQFAELEESLMSKNTNYIIFKGTEKKNIKKLEAELGDFTLDDLQTLKLHEAICSVNYLSGRHTFISKMLL